MSKETSYIILSSSDDQVWQIEGSISASGQEAALRKWLGDGIGDTPRETLAASFVLVPERSWQPTQPQIQVVKRFSFEKRERPAHAPPDPLPASV